MHRKQRRPQASSLGRPRSPQQYLRGTPPPVPSSVPNKAAAQEPPLPQPPHPVRLPGEGSEDDERVASWRSTLRRESFGKGDTSFDAAAAAPTPAPATRRRPIARALPIASSPPSHEDGAESGSPSSASDSGEQGPPEWAFQSGPDMAHATRKHASAKRPPRAYHKPTPGPSPSTSPVYASHAKQIRKSHRGSATPSPVLSPAGALGGRSGGKAARRVPSWPAGESAARRSSKSRQPHGGTEVAARLPRSVSFALTRPD